MRPYLVTQHAAGFRLQHLVKGFYQVVNVYPNAEMAFAICDLCNQVPLPAPPRAAILIAAWRINPAIEPWLFEQFGYRIPDKARGPEWQAAKAAKTAAAKTKAADRTARWRVDQKADKVDDPVERLTLCQDEQATEQT